MLVDVKKICDPDGKMTRTIEDYDSAKTRAGRLADLIELCTDISNKLTPHGLSVAKLREMALQMCGPRTMNALRELEDELAAVERIRPLLSKISQLQSDIDNE